MSDQIKDSKKNAVVPYVPGDFTAVKHRDPSHAVLAQHRLTQEQMREAAAPLKGYPRTREDFTRRIEHETPDDFYEKHREMLSDEYIGRPHCHRKDKRLMSPIIAAIRNFDLAKKLHKENLEHQPLPDTVTDAMYRKLQMQSTREPGLALKEGNYASGVAWKAYAGYGPTRCTKLRVFRPKTSITHKIKDSANDRPSSVNSFDRKWRFIRQRKVTPIQLAVCWDLTPVNPNDEPKRTPHIDGSNGSLAPAVFSLVHSPKGVEDPNVQKTSVCEQEPKCDGLHDTNQKLPYMYDPQAYRPKTASNSRDHSSSHSMQRVHSAEQDKKLHPPSVHSFHTKIHHSSPNLSQSSGFQNYCSKECYKEQIQPNKRLCVACEMKNINIKDTRPKSDYKMAFKAGIPQKNFKRQDYPEHWRLATVYQHSYKPMQARKRPLIETVFK